MERVHDFVERENAINNLLQAIHGDELRATTSSDDPNNGDNELAEAL
jgi:hypothetical protein